jgi:hypothetical protein
MSLHPQEIPPIPEETRRVAQAAFPRSNVYMRIRDELSAIYDDQPFAPLFPAHGRIDDFTLPKPTRFFTGASGSQSPFFNVQLRPSNVLVVDETAVPELVLSPSAEQGYYLFVRPLRAGPHTIRWIASGCTPGNSQDITYHLTVVSGSSGR